MIIKDGKITGYVLILDKNGMPKIADPRSVPASIWKNLTDEQKAFANANVIESLRRSI